MPTFTTTRVHHANGKTTVRVKRSGKLCALIIHDPEWPSAPWAAYPAGADRDSDPACWGEFATEGQALRAVRDHTKP